MRRLGPYPAFYLSFFGFFAVSRSFFAIHCKDIGFSAFEIGVITSAEDLATIIGPLVGIHAATVWLAPKNLVVLATALSILIYLPLFGVDSFVAVLTLWFLACSLMRAPLMLVEAQAITDAIRQNLHYGRIRIWGSVGFLVATWLLGISLDLFGPGSILWVGLFLLILVLYSVYLVKPALSNERGGAGERVASSSFLRVCLRPEYANIKWLLIVSALHWGSMGTFYAYFSLYLRALGFGGSIIGVAWMVSIIGELFAFTWYHHLERRFSQLFLLRASILLLAVRWVMLWYSDSLGWILASQILHVFPIVSFSIPSMKLAHQFFPEEFRSQAQGILIAIGLGVGVFLGRILAGFGALFISSDAELDTLFLLSAMMAMVSYFYSRRIKEVDVAQDGAK